MPPRARKTAVTGPLIPEMVPIGKLKLDPHNANTHPDRNLAAIVESLRRFGQVKPIVITKGRVVVAGNGTMLAAQQLELTELSAIVYPGTAAEARAYAIADNRTAELAEWDTPELLAQLADMDTGLQLAAGFADDEMLALLGQVDKIPDVDPEPDSGGGREVKFTVRDKTPAVHTCPACGHEFTDTE